MSAQGLEVIDETVQHTHVWLNELAERIETPDRRRALRLLRSTMTAVRDHLPHTVAAHLSAQLPLLIRGFYWEGWRPSETPVKDRSWDGFLGQIAANYDPEPGATLAEDVEEVFRLLNHRLTEGEVESVRRSLPTGVAEKWVA